MNIIIMMHIITALVGITIGWLIASYRHAKRKIDQSVKQELIIEKLGTAMQQISLKNNFQHKCKLLNKEIRHLHNINTSFKADLRKITTHLKLKKLYTKEKIYQILKSENLLNERFENLAHRIFEKSNRRIDEQNQKNLNMLLAPLLEQLDNFRRQVQENFKQEKHERHTLACEIQNLQKLNSQIAQEAIHLVKILRGNNKIQGNWGEMILSRVLETSGLRNGYEYETQVNIKIDKNSHVHPDVIVHLPQGKDIIIDAKMTLIAYERYFNAKDEPSRKLALQDHITSIRNHIRLLGRKNYQKLPGIHTLDYVLMFIPIESALLLALNNQPELLTEALKYNIMLVSPTTLLIALRTITNFWRHEYQNQNAQKIATQASKLYEKISLFFDAMLSVGRSLDSAQDNYKKVMKKLISGKDNLLTQAEVLRSLGIEVKHEINHKLAYLLYEDKE